MSAKTLVDVSPTAQVEEQNAMRNMTSASMTMQIEKG